MWILIISTSILMMIMMYILISIFEYKFLTKSYKEADYFSVSQISWFIYSALVKQGSILSPSADVSRSRNMIGREIYIEFIKHIIGYYLEPGGCSSP